MEGDKDVTLLSSLGGSSLVVALLAALGFGAWHAVAPLVAHPAGAAGGAGRLNPVPRIEARLWQDPFEVISLRPEDAARPRSLPPAEQLAVLLADQPSAQVLAVSIGSGSYAEDRERRRRARVAVVEALQAAGAVAADASHLSRLGDVAFEWFLRTDAGGPPILLLWLPEEVLLASVQLPTAAKPADQSTSASPDRAPPTALARWRQDVLTRLADLRPDQTVLAMAAPWTVLGPNDSATLEALRQAIDPGHPPAACSHAVGVKGEESVAGGAGMQSSAIRYFTSSATRPVDCPDAGDPSGSTPSANQGLTGTGIVRLAATDRQLADALVAELKLRGISPFLRRDWQLPSAAEILAWDFAAPRDAMAVISEADTPYGRAMPEIFCRSLAQDAHRQVPLNRACRTEPWAAAGLFGFSYLRGLNGERPGARSQRASSAKSDAGGGGGGEAKPDNNAEGAAGSATPTAPAPQTTVAEGDAETDYLDRLAGQLQDLDRALRAGQTESSAMEAAGEDGAAEARSKHEFAAVAGMPARPRHPAGRERAPRGLRAVGLLGSDVYDKLMLLRALKPRLPDVVFFTTDLDARLLDDAQLPWTRNLVLASGTGLALSPAAQSGFAPFRDSYQTALYRAARLVLAGGTETAAEDESCIAELTARVHVYEIGRSDVFEFNGVKPARQCGHPGWKPFLAEPADVPDAFTARERAGLCMTALGLTLAAVLWGSPLARSRLRHACTDVDEDQAARRLVWGGGLMLLGVVVAGMIAGWGWPRIAAWTSGTGDGQPFAWAQGLSVWPPLLLLLVAIAVALFATALVPGQLSRNLAELHDWLALQPAFSVVEHALEDARRREPWSQRLLRDFLPTSMVRAPARQQLQAQTHGAGDPAMAAIEDGTALPAFWHNYLRAGLDAARRKRVGLMLLLLVVLLWILENSIDNHLPQRGLATPLAYAGLNFVAMATLIAMMLTVAEASLFCTDFFELLRVVPHEWPEELVARMASRLGVSTRLAVAWLQLQLAARRSAAVAPLIYLPFLFLSVLIVSHSSVFSPWHMNTQQAVVVVAVGAVTVFCAWRLRRSAERLRVCSLAAVEAEQEALRFRRGADANALAALDRLADAMREVDDGALAPFAAQPWLRSLLPPLLSLASTRALDLFGLG